MTRTPIDTVLRHMSGPGPERGADITDAELLQRFATGQDEAAFAALVRRYGRLVWAVCRRALGHDQDAEDAFQATFLVLARKADTIRRQAVGSWLHGVARRVALTAKRGADRRRAHERRKMSNTPSARDDPAGTDLTDALAVVDEEVGRLSERSRAAFVLCCLEGATAADAARRLGLTEGAVAVALSRARKQLRGRLTRRGITLTAVLSAFDLVRHAVSAAVPVRLVNAAASAGAGHPAVASARATALAEGVKAMTTVKPGIMMALLLTIAGLGMGVSASGHQPAAHPPVNGAPASVDKAKPTAADGVAWGKPVGGLQAGIGYRSGGRRAYQVGGLVPLVVKVRNVGPKPVTFAYQAGFFDEVRPDVLAADGRPTPVAMPPTWRALRPILEQSLQPGEATDLGEYRVGVDPDGEDGKVRRPTVTAGPGTYTVGYAGFAKDAESLSTGQLQVVVTAAVGGKKTAGGVWPGTDGAGAKLVGRWQDTAGGVRLLEADGTGKNPDGSRFRWYLEGDFLVAQAVGGDGPVGEPVKIPILFASDGEEYATLHGGGRRPVFSKLGPDGRPAGTRTPADKKYPRAPVARADDGVPQPVPVEPGAGGEAPPKDGPVRVGPNVQVSKARADLPHGEVVLAADPRDPKRLVAASMFQPILRPEPAPGIKVVVYASADGGTTWEPTLERTGAAADQFADPTLAFGPDGAVVFGYMTGSGLGEFRSGGNGRLEFARSTDGGRTWGPAARIDAYHDRPFLAVDGTGGTYRGRVYCVTHRGAVVSTDGGKSFGEVRPFERPPGHDAFPAGPVVVLSDGTLVALYGGLRSAVNRPAGGAKTAPGPKAGYLAVRRSADGGATFSGEVRVGGYGSDINPPAVAADGGRGAFRDRVYVVWEDRQAGRRARVLLARSMDRGETFSTPVVLSEQPEDVGVTRPDYAAFLPAVAVNKNGVVGVTWYDTRGLGDVDAGWDVRLRVSPDGGDTWLPSVRVSEESTRHDPKRKVRFYTGHTAGLAADADGVFHALWADGRTGTNQVWTTTVVVDRK